MIEFKDVVVKFNENTAVHKTNLVIKDNEIFGIIGASGAGKSSLLRTINNLVSISSGDILVNDKSIINLSKPQLKLHRSNIGMIFQHFNLINNQSVYQNIEFVLLACHYPKKDIKKRIIELLKLVGLEDKITSYPASLSGGQKQRVAIARALANKETKILLCDEATSALDPNISKSILDLLVEIKQKYQLCIVLITHEINVVKSICDRIAVMDEGYIVEVNDTYEIFSNPQHQFTKNLINAESSDTIPSSILNLHQANTYRLTYTNSNAQEPLLYNLCIKNNVVLNIIHGQIEYLQNKSLGHLSVSLIGNANDVAKVIYALKANNVKVEVLNNEN